MVEYYKSSIYIGSRLVTCYRVAILGTVTCHAQNKRLSSLVSGDDVTKSQPAQLSTRSFRPCFRIKITATDREKLLFHSGVTYAYSYCRQFMGKLFPCTVCLLFELFEGEQWRNVYFLLYTYVI